LRDRSRIRSYFAIGRASIARGRRWLDEIITGAVTDVEQIAAREKCSARKTPL
jgi:hypothetical protein